MYKTTFRPPLRHEKRRQRQVKYKITLFFAACKLFQDVRSSFDFFCNFVEREGVCVGNAISSQRSDMPSP